MECKKCEENWKEREEDDRYWSEQVEEREKKIKELKKVVSSLKGQIKLAIKRKNWWKITFHILQSQNKQYKK